MAMHFDPVDLRLMVRVAEANSLTCSGLPTDRGRKQGELACARVRRWQVTVNYPLG